MGIKMICDLDFLLSRVLLVEFQGFPPVETWGNDRHSAFLDQQRQVFAVLWIGWSKCFFNQSPGFGTALISSAILWCTVWSVSLSLCLFEWWTEVIICCLLKQLGSWLLCRTDTSVHLLLSALHWTHSWHLKKSRTWRKQGHTYILIAIPALYV